MIFHDYDCRNLIVNTAKGIGNYNDGFWIILNQSADLTGEQMQVVFQKCIEIVYFASYIRAFVNQVQVYYHSVRISQVIWRNTVNSFIFVDIIFRGFARKDNFVGW